MGFYFGPSYYSTSGQKVYNGEGISATLEQLEQMIQLMKSLVENIHILQEARVTYTSSSAAPAGEQDCDLAPAAIRREEDDGNKDK